MLTRRLDGTWLDSSCKVQHQYNTLCIQPERVAYVVVSTARVPVRASVLTVANNTWVVEHSAVPQAEKPLLYICITRDSIIMAPCGFCLPRRFLPPLYLPFILLIGKQ